jgi:hypothetical protein
MNRNRRNRRLGWWWTIAASVAALCYLGPAIGAFRQGGASSIALGSFWIFAIGFHSYRFGSKARYRFLLACHQAAHPTPKQTESNPAPPDARAVT